jgi:hypothetical protein
LSSDAPAAQAVDVPGVEVAEILAALGTVVHIWLQAIVALALTIHLVVIRMQRYLDFMAIFQVSEDIGLTHFPVSIPSRSQAAMAAGRAVSPHNSFLELQIETD